MQFNYIFQQYVDGYVVYVVGKGGDAALLWKDDWEMFSLLFFTDVLIDPEHWNTEVSEIIKACLRNLF